MRAPLLTAWMSPDAKRRYNSERLRPEMYEASEMESASGAVPASPDFACRRSVRVELMIVCPCVARHGVRRRGTRLNGLRLARLLIMLKIQKLDLSWIKLLKLLANLALCRCVSVLIEEPLHDLLLQF